MQCEYLSQPSAYICEMVCDALLSHSYAADTSRTTNGSSSISFVSRFSTHYWCYRLHTCKNIIAGRLAYAYADFMIQSYNCNSLLLSVQAESFRNRKGYFSLNVQTCIFCRFGNFGYCWVVAWRKSWSNNFFCVQSKNAFWSRAIRPVYHGGWFWLLNLATPYTTNHPGLEMDTIKRRYQAALISTRNVVERQYGVFKRRSRYYDMV